jgi:prophage antirepressor-like protein
MSEQSNAIELINSDNQNNCSNNQKVADTIFDLINRAEKFGDRSIDIVIVNGEPWFKGKDVAIILGYDNTTKTIRDNIDLDDRTSIYDLTRKVRTGSAYPKYNKNQLKTIYINESGLYALVLNSKLPAAKQFKKWVTRELLPSIGKNLQTELIEYKAQLENTKTELIEYKQQITKLENKQLKLESFVRNIKKLEKNQVFYIATTPNYARQNRFEYGGVKDIKELRPRLSGYNTGRAEGDLYYYTKIFKCNNYKLIEDRVGSILQQFKDKLDSRKEMIHLRYNLFVEIADFICDNYDREIEYINNRCMEFLNETIEHETIIPKAIDLNDYIAIVVRRNGMDERAHKIDITGWTDADINAEIERIITRCVIEKKNIEYDILRDKDRVAILLEWPLITPYLELYQGLKKTEWRAKFKSWFSVAKPAQMRIKGIACNP